MARVPMITQKTDLAPEHHKAFDSIAASRGSVRGPFSVLLHSPEMASRAAHLGAYLRFEGKLSNADKELAIISVAREMDCQFEWAGHVVLARKAGVREAAITAIRDRKAPAGLTPEEAQIVGYAQQLLRNHRVDEATFRALRDRIGTTGLVELTTTVGYYGMIACNLNAFEVTPEAGAELLPV